MKIIEIMDLTKAYGRHKVLDSLVFDIDQSGIYALVGPNGSGKTTLFSTMANILQKDRGTIKIFDLDNTDIKIFDNMTFLKDNNILYDYLSGYDHLDFLASVHKIGKERIGHVIDFLGIRSYMGIKTGKYSLGMKQHLILAMNILVGPKLMLLDEPLNGLDPTSIIKFRKIFKKLAEDGTTIILSSHTLSEIDLLTDNIFFLKDGKILRDKDSDQERHKYIFVLKDKDDKIYDFVNDHISYDQDKLELIYTDQDKNLYDFIKLLQGQGIVFTDIRCVNYGSESRYMAMYPEEVKKIENLFED